VGYAYDRTDKVVLAAIVQGCMRKAADAFEQLDDGGASVLHGVGVMLFEVGAGDDALLLLDQALEKRMAIYGEEAIEIAETVYMIGQCHSKADIADEEIYSINDGHKIATERLTGLTVRTADTSAITDSKSKGCYELALRVTEHHFGVDHVATARYLITISKSLKEKLKYCRRGIALIEAAESPDKYSGTHADALFEIGSAYGWIPHNSSFGFSDMPRLALGVFASLDRF
jgi:hypothetical protein